MINIKDLIKEKEKFFGITRFQVENHMKFPFRKDKNNE